jgi:hypothetical protein
MQDTKEETFKMPDGEVDQREKYPHEWQGPLRSADPFYAGRRFISREKEVWENGSVSGKRDKLARRAIRKNGLQGQIERAIWSARRKKANLDKLACNSHEKRRNLEKIKAEEAREKAAAATGVKWWDDMFAVWARLGQAYAELEHGWNGVHFNYRRAKRLKAARERLRVEIEAKLAADAAEKAVQP